MAQRIIVERAESSGKSLVFRALTGALQRLRGLLGTTPQAEPVALVGCSSIHTFGMRYRIDVAFVASDWTVLAVWHAVPPGRVLSHPGSQVVLERPHQRGGWFVKGEWVRITHAAL